jgi:aldose 1-epimerase
MRSSSDAGIDEVTLGQFTAYRLHAGEAEAEIIPRLGGTVRQVSLSDPLSGKARPLMRADEAAELAVNPWFRGRILFPLNDRIPEGRYSFGGKEYRLKPNSPEDGSAIHGLICGRELEILRKGTDGQSVFLALQTELKPADCAGTSGLPGYPGRLALTLTYSLCSGGFSLFFEAENRGSEPAPLSFGWHPYFVLGVKADELILSHGGSSYVPVGRDLMPLGGHASVQGSGYDFRKGRLIGSGPLDIALTAPPDGKASLSDGRLRIIYQASPEVFAYTQLFVPPERDSVAMEPITGATNSFNLPDLGRKIIAPGERISAAVHLSLEACL